MTVLILLVAYMHYVIFMLESISVLIIELLFYVIVLFNKLFEGWKILLLTAIHLGIKQWLNLCHVSSCFFFFCFLFSISYVNSACWKIITSHCDYTTVLAYQIKKEEIVLAKIVCTAAISGLVARWDLTMHWVGNCIDMNWVWGVCSFRDTLSRNYYIHRSQSLFLYLPSSIIIIHDLHKIINNLRAQDWRMIK